MNLAQPMQIEPIPDFGQKIAAPAGKVIGFLDTKANFEAFATAVQVAGYPAASITSLCGDEGVQLLERLKENSFFFADSEDSIIQLSIKELKLGHYAAAVEVPDHSQAMLITNLAIPLGGHNFSYFGTWISEKLSS